MKSTSILMVLTLSLIGPVFAQDGEGDEPGVLEGIQIPKEHTPVYHCVRSFFALPVQIRVEHDDLDSLMDDWGIPKTDAIKGLMIQLAAKTLVGSEAYSELDRYESNPGVWKEEQYRLIRKEIKAYKDLYDAFLWSVAEEGMDRDALHAKIVEKGRDIVIIAVDGELDVRHKAALEIFEDPNTANPWLD